MIDDEEKARLEAEGGDNLIMSSKHPVTGKWTHYVPFFIIYQSKAMRSVLMEHGLIIVSMDSTHCTTPYGFKLFALVSLDGLRHIRTFAVFIVQHETIPILTFCLKKVVEHMRRTEDFVWNPKIVIVDKSDAEIASVGSVWPDALKWLCICHVHRDLDRALCSHVGKSGSLVLKLLFENMMYTTNRRTLKKFREKILQHPLVCDHHELQVYLKNEWFNCEEMWTMTDRQFYHKRIDTTNISESWNHTVKSILRTLQNKEVSTIFPCIVEDILLVEALKAADVEYSQSSLWRNQSKAVYADLEEIEFKGKLSFTRLDLWSMSNMATVVFLKFYRSPKRHHR